MESTGIRARVKYKRDRDETRSLSLLVIPKSKIPVVRGEKLKIILKRKSRRKKEIYSKKRKEEKTRVTINEIFVFFFFLWQQFQCPWASKIFGRWLQTERNRTERNQTRRECRHFEIERLLARYSRQNQRSRFSPWHQFEFPNFMRSLTCWRSLELSGNHGRLVIGPLQSIRQLARVRWSRGKRVAPFCFFIVWRLESCRHERIITWLRVWIIFFSLRNDRWEMERYLENVSCDHWSV